MKKKKHLTGETIVFLRLGLIELILKNEICWNTWRGCYEYLFLMILLSAVTRCSQCVSSCVADLPVKSLLETLGMLSNDSPPWYPGWLKPPVSTNKPGVLGLLLGSL